jgi:hypothetical protein
MNEYPNGPAGMLIRTRAPREVRGTLLRNFSGFITMMSQANSSNIRSAVLPINTRLYPEREIAPITTISQ